VQQYLQVLLFLFYPKKFVNVLSMLQTKIFSVLIHIQLVCALNNYLYPPRVSTVFTKSATGSLNESLNVTGVEPSLGYAPLQPLPIHDGRGDIELSYLGGEGEGERSLIVSYIFYQWSFLWFRLLEENLKTIVL